MSRVKCISHSQDIDGLVCAALLKMSRGADCVLVDYVNLPDEVMKIKGEVGEVYICDLGISESLIEDLKNVARTAKVVYIDHHPLKSEILGSLREMGVEVVHSTAKCAGMLTYQYLQKELPEEASFLAAYATLSDYPSSAEDVALFLERFDPQLLAFETSLLYYAVARAEEDEQFKHRIVDGLSRLKQPHEIHDVMRYAIEHVDYILGITRNVDDRLVYCKNLAYIEVLGNISVIANTLVRVSKKPTVICYSRYWNGEKYNLSIRSRDKRYNLGAIAAKIAKELGGSGGGHPLAAGAQLSIDCLNRFITELDEALNI